MPERRSLPALLSIAVLAAVAGCAGSPSEATPHDQLHGDLAPSLAVASPGLVKEVHAVTSRFHSPAQATKAGYAVASPCIAHPTLGAMGFHWVNQGLVDPVFDPRAPEGVLYAPDANGNNDLVAVEYIVINVGQPAPTFDGHPFDVGGTPVPVAHWSLHLWVHRENPNGIFTPFNPAVSCL